MKKMYVKPIVEAIEVEFESLMTTTSGETGGVGTGSGQVGDGTEELAIHRRGSWGDLWK